MATRPICFDVQQYCSAAPAALDGDAPIDSPLSDAERCFATHAAGYLTLGTGGSPEAAFRRAVASAAVTAFLPAGIDPGMVVEDAGATEDINVCPACGARMVEDPAASELRCVRCYAHIELFGTVFREGQFYNQEGQKAKSGTFVAKRYLRKWLSLILATESDNELATADDPPNQPGVALLRNIRRLARRDNKILGLLTVDDIRAMLKELGCSQFSQNVSLILKRLTGVAPPVISEVLLQRVERIFVEVIIVEERLRMADSPLPGKVRRKRSYYPYYIYRILDALLPPGDPQGEILSYIHLQHDDTISKDSDLWKQICAEVTELQPH
jgi:hypothetical protein